MLSHGRVRPSTSRSFVTRYAPATWRRAILAASTTLCTAAAADDGACIRARDTHADFKAVWAGAPSGKPREELVRHNPDGTVEIDSVFGQTRIARTTIKGLFVKVEKRSFSGREVETAYSHTVDVASLLPLRAGASADYRTIIVRTGQIEPQFSDVAFSVGAPREAMIGGCRLNAFDVSIDARAAASGSLKAFHSHSRLVYVPDLAYWIEGHTTFEFDGRKRDPIDTKVMAIEDRPH